MNESLYVQSLTRSFFQCIWAYRLFGMFVFVCLCLMHGFICVFMHPCKYEHVSTPACACPPMWMTIGWDSGECICTVLTTYSQSYQQDVDFFILSTQMEGFSRMMKSACQGVFDGVWWYLAYMCVPVFVSERLCVFHHNHCKRRKRLCDQQKCQMTAAANKGGSLESRG